MGILITLSDILGLFLFAIVCLILLVFWIRSTIRQSRCSHPRVGETQACDAICSECGKNLGFIGHWREAQKAKELLK